MTRSRSRRANEAWEALLTAHAALMKRFAAEPIWGELSMREYDVLYTLSKHDEPLRLFELGRGVLLSQPALSRLVDRLAERGLIERAPDPEDGRGVRLALTEAGREQQRRVGGRHAVDVARAVTAALTDEEIAALEAIGRKLAAQGAATPAQRHHEEAVL
ncbi:MarR family transcriptional regulator [Glycomyces sp. NPDC021274]|uniref:MarR family winged helix-turn-helix transcriptional regulator n=1 Tax=Glycomyces sp. NPDC021274 TaxID=3155120 RepID=UPI00340DCD54